MPKGVKMKVLFAEDSIFSRESMTNFLELMFDTVYVAEDGKMAYDMFLENKDIDLLITDLHMPNIDGDELIKKVKRQRGDLVVVLVSAFEEEAKERLQTQLKHCNRCIVMSKPLSCNEFVSKLVSMDTKFEYLKRFL